MAPPTVSASVPSSAAATPARVSWRQAWRVYLEPASLRMLALGFSAGLPLLLVLGTLSFRLREAGLDRATIGYLSWVGLAYGFKWCWAPLVDRLPLPLLTPWLGRRRSWLLLSQLAIAGGQYRLFLGLGLNASLTGLFLAHLLPVAAYVLIVLQGPYRAFDGRYMQAARALCVSGLGAWAKVKLPLLKAPLLTTAAIAFAVSIAQFVPAQLIAAGRHSTLPMEAVTLASGGNRSLTAAFALALTLPPLLAFLAAALLGRPRWR